MDDQHQKPPQLEEDWNPDYFPTSAKPIFKVIGFLVLAITILILAGSYFAPDYQEKEEPEVEVIADEDIDPFQVNPQKEE